MPSILATNALTTLAAVNDELTLTSDGGGAQDQRVERFINAASDWIERWCARTFRREDAIVENVKGFGKPTIRLARPIVSITSIVLNGMTLDADEYTIEDAERGRVFRSAGWPWTAGQRPGITSPRVPGWEDPTQIVVTYNGGWVTPAQVALGTFATRTLPWQIEDACIRLVASRWRTRGTDANVTSKSDQNSGQTFDETPVPRSVIAALAPYARYPSA